MEYPFYECGFVWNRETENFEWFVKTVEPEPECYEEDYGI